jgi:hypothetical protein
MASDQVNEAAARSRRLDAASPALERLSDRTGRIGSDWALGTEARCRALLSDDPAAEALHVEAIERLERSRIRTELARAQLVYGEWLRRQGRRIVARTMLRAARESFAAMGARPLRNAPTLNSWQPATRLEADPWTRRRNSPDRNLG